MGRNADTQAIDASAAEPDVRIAVLAAADSAILEPTIDALRGLGRQAQLEVFHDLVLSDAALAGAVDLVVADAGLGAALDARLERLRDEGGPPVVVVCAPEREGRAIEAFRCGASDCVVAAADLDRALATSVLEQLRRAGEAREQAHTAALGERVEDLERVTRSLVENMNSALVVLDADGRVRYANPVAEQVLGMPATALEGRAIAERFAVGAVEDPIGQTLREGTRFRNVELTLRREDGRPVPVGMSTAPLLGTDAAHGAAVLIFEDLSETKLLQRQVVQTEKMASIGQLAAGVAHEINNPMGFIHANLCQVSEYLGEFAQLWEHVEALRKAASQEPHDAGGVRAAVGALDRAMVELDADFLLGDVGKAVRESLEGSERIRHIVQDLRAFSHQGQVERTLADVNKALDSTANIVWTMMKHQVVLTKHYDELPPIPCYPMQLKQVFMNLLVNATHAIAESDAPRGEIRLRTRLQGDGVSVTISDNGVGIPADAQARIFDPFFTTKEVGEGTGLGLSTSYNLIDRHGGRITLESEPGVGTTFEVWLPLGDDDMPSSEERP